MLFAGGWRSLCETVPVTHDRSTAVLGRQPQGRGVQHCCNPPSPSGFSPPVPHFPSSPSPLGHGRALYVSTMLRRTGMNRVLRRKSWEPSQADVSPKRGESVEKRAREKTVGRGENKQLCCALSPPKEVVSRTAQSGQNCILGLSPQASINSLRRLSLAQRKAVKAASWGCLPKIVANPYNKKQGLRPVQIILRQFSPGAALRDSDSFRT